MRVFFVLLCLALPFGAAAQSGDPVTGFSDQDAVMNAAMATAGDTLGLFLDNATNARGEGLPGAMVKVAFDTGATGVEIIWVSPFIWDTRGNFAGLLANQPNYMDGLNYGDRVDFSSAMIRDWALQGDDGLLYGHYTTRVIVEQLDPDQRRAIEATLSPQPVPDAW